MRGAVGVELENIVTWWERDISHSAPERIILEDVFHALHFMLRRMTTIMTDLVVYEVRVKENLELTQGVIYSSEVKALLAAGGMDPQQAYYLTQELALEAWGEQKNFLDLLLASPEIPESLKQGPLHECFNLEAKLQYVPVIFERFGL